MRKMLQQYLNEIIFIAFSFIYFTIESFHDFYLIKWKQSYDTRDEKKYSNYWHRIDVLMHLSVAVFICFVPVKFLFPQNIFAVALFGITRFFHFDTLLNKLRNLDLNYIGVTTDLDKLLSKIHINPIIIKSVLFVITIILFVISKDW